MKWALVDSNDIVQNIIVYNGISPLNLTGTELTLEQVQLWIEIGMNINTPEPTRGN